jgi:hypothetical protein
MTRVSDRSVTPEVRPIFASDHAGVTGQVQQLDVRTATELLRIRTVLEHDRPYHFITRVLNEFVDFDVTLNEA